MMVLRRLWSDDEGQDLVEYALLVALVSIVSITILGTLGTRSARCSRKPFPRLRQPSSIIAQFAASFTDYRGPELVEHMLSELVAQRV